MNNRRYRGWGACLEPIVLNNRRYRGWGACLEPIVLNNRRYRGWDACQEPIVLNNTRYRGWDACLEPIVLNKTVASAKRVDMVHTRSTRGAGMLARRRKFWRRKTQCLECMPGADIV